MSAFDIDEQILEKCPCGRGQVETLIGTPGHCWSLAQITKRSILCPECSVKWRFNSSDKLEPAEFRI